MLPIGGLIRRLDAHHMRPTLALELQRLALGRIEVRNLADFDGDRHAGGRQTAKSTSSNRPGLRSFRVLRFRRLTSNVTQ